MKSIVLIASASALALGLGACADKPAPRAALDCPASEGELTLKTKAADGKTCFYTAEGGSEVTLQLISGRADATLDRLEMELLAGRAATKSDEAAEATGAAKSQAKAEADAARAEARAVKAEAKADAAKGGVTVKADVDSGVDIDVKGNRSSEGIEVNDEEGTARINLPGIHIEADDKNDSARVQVGPIKINANGDEATIRIRNDHRLKGEALSTEKRGVRATFISKVKGAADGYRYVGYEAAGPKTGPITVGVLKAKTGDGGENLHEDVVKLVRRNGGV